MVLVLVVVVALFVMHVKAGVGLFTPGCKTASQTCSDNQLILLRVVKHQSKDTSPKKMFQQHDTSATKSPNSS